LKQFKTHRQNNGIADYIKEARALRQVARNCNITEPEQVKSWLAADEKIWKENVDANGTTKQKPVSAVPTLHS